MAIQGLENGASFRAKHVTKVRTAKSDKQSRFPGNVGLNSPPASVIEKDRSELITLIRKKIKKGFYNSDKVIDDLSYGFADALDRTV